MKDWVKNLPMGQILLGVAAVAAITLLTIVIMSFTYTNKEVRLREAIEAKIDVNESCYTKMWEIITQQANVSAKYAEDFKEIYPDLIAGRYSNGQGQLMNWITEHNPQFDTGLYSKLSSSIESQRETFHTNQEQLRDLSREHSALLKTKPSKWFLKGIKEIDVPIVINDAAEKAFATGKEPEMKLFE